MKALPEIGTRVRVTRSHNGTTCTGVVHAHHRGGDRCKDEETGETWTTPDSIGVTVDLPLPEWWPYDPDPGGPWYRKFAPDASEVEPLK